MPRKNVYLFYLFRSVNDDQLWVVVYDTGFSPLGQVPFGWIHLCLDIDANNGRLKSSVNGESVKEDDHNYQFTKDINFNISLGKDIINYNQLGLTNMISLHFL